MGTAGDTASATSASGDTDGFETGFDKELWIEWLNVLSEWSTYKSKQSDYIKDLVRRGVPMKMRPKVWQLLANAQQVTPQTSENYRNMLNRSSNCEKLIQRDIARTYPENDYFKDEAGPGQEGLFNVIKVYSLHDEEVGYCQGSAFIVGLLLLQLSEEESFMLLCRIMEDYRMREIYKPTMAELGLCIYQLECLVQDQLPELYMHFRTQNFYTSMYSSSWFLTLFTSNLPLHLAYRVMDLFLSEGLEMIFRLSVAILQICRDDLLKLDMEGLLKYFQKEMPSRIECATDYLIKCACLVKYDCKKMKKLSKDYTTIKMKEQEEAIEYNRLRTENRLLQQKLKEVETEFKDLADKHIKDQVSHAQAYEDNFVIKRELGQMRSSDELQKATIAELKNRIDELEKSLRDRTIVQSKEQEMMCEGLQGELVAVKLREAENQVEIKELNKKITEQELYIKSLRENVPEDPIAQLQEELSAVKLREAEANFAMKELRNKFNELQTLWSEHLQQVHGISANMTASQPSSLEASNGSAASTTPLGSNSQSASLNATNVQSINSCQASQPSSLTSSLASSNPLTKFFNNSVIKRASGSVSVSANSDSGPFNDQQELQRLKQDMLTLKIHEANATAEVKMLRSREMELETQIKIQDNKIKRREDEFKRLEEKLRSDLEEVTHQLKEEKEKRVELEWKTKEDNLLRGIKDVEYTRVTGELRQRISQLESKIEEIKTMEKLTESGIEPKDASEYQERVAELQSESFRLDASNRKLHDMERKNVEREREG